MSIYNSFESELTAIMGLEEEYDGIGLQEEDELDGLDSAESYGMVVRDQMAIESAFFVMENYGFENFTTSTEGVGKFFKGIYEVIKKICEKIVSLLKRFFNWIKGVIGGLFNKNKAVEVASIVKALPTSDVKAVEVAIEQVIEAKEETPSSRSSTAHADNTRSQDNKRSAMDAAERASIEKMYADLFAIGEGTKAANEIGKIMTEAANDGLGHVEEVVGAVKGMFMNTKSSKADVSSSNTLDVVEKIKTQFEERKSGKKKTSLKVAKDFASVCTDARKDHKQSNKKMNKLAEVTLKQMANGAMDSRLRGIQSVVTNLVTKSAGKTNSRVESINKQIVDLAKDIDNYFTSEFGTAADKETGRTTGASMQRGSYDGMKNALIAATKEISEVTNMTISLNNELLHIVKDDKNAVLVVEAALKKAAKDGKISIKVDASQTSMKDWGEKDRKGGGRNANTKGFNTGDDRQLA